MKIKKGVEMKAYTFRVHLDSLGELRAKADEMRMPVSLIIRKLIEKFLKGEIKLD